MQGQITRRLQIFTETLSSKLTGFRGPESWFKYSLELIYTYTFISIVSGTYNAVFTTCTHKTLLSRRLL